MISELKLARIKREMTQVDLWLKTDIPQWRISLIERGLIPRSEEKRKIADVLGLPLEDLFPPVDQTRAGGGDK